MMQNFNTFWLYVMSHGISDLNLPPRANTDISGKSDIGRALNISASRMTEYIENAVFNKVAMQNGHPTCLPVMHDLNFKEIKPVIVKHPFDDNDVAA